MIIIKFTNIKPSFEEDEINEESPAYLTGIINWQLASGLNTWNPPFDLLETESDYIIRVEIAGMQERDFDVSFDNHTVLIRGKRQDEMEFCTYHQMEIPFGEFSFKVEIPGKVLIDQIHGEYGNGFLKISLPKAGKTNLPISASNEQEN